MKFRLNPAVASFLGAIFLRLLAVTWRIECRGTERLERARQISPTVIFAFWHGRMLALSWPHRKWNVHILASEHYDGDLVGRILERIGFGHIKGSTSRGGAKALRDLKAAMSSGLDIGLTVDGPRGPRGNVEKGVIELARMSSSPVIPVTAAATWRKTLRSWDRFQLPAPFTRILVDYGEPVVVDPGADAGQRELLRKKLQKELAALTVRVDVDSGHEGSEVWPHEGG